MPGVSGSSMSSEGLLVSPGFSQFVFLFRFFWVHIHCFTLILLPFVLTENEVSFTLNLFPDGYSFGKPSEVCFKEK